MPAAAPTAYLLSLGEELLEGRVQDRNGSYFAQELLRRGFHVVGMRILGDAPDALAVALAELDGKVDLILSTGGLGPTVDDRVRAEAAAYVCRPLCPASSHAESDLRRLYARHRSGEPPAFFLAQGLVPEGALPLANAAGTAWGFYLPLRHDTHYAALPGPPQECAVTFHQGGLATQLEAEFPQQEIYYALLHTVGAPESVVEARIRDLMEGVSAARIGITAGAERVSVSLLAYRHDGECAEARGRALKEELRQRLGDLLYGEGSQSLAEVVLASLRHRGHRLVVAESCTGGLLGAAVTAVPGASEVFFGGFLTYANEAKTRFLGVPEAMLEAHGAVSAEVAAAMAQGARAATGADWALATTGIAGPGGGSESKPVGTVYLGLAGPDGFLLTRRRRQYARGGRQVIQTLTVRDALDSLRRQLAGLPPLDETA